METANNLSVDCELPTKTFHDSTAFERFPIDVVEEVVDASERNHTYTTAEANTTASEADVDSQINHHHHTRSTISNTTSSSSFNSQSHDSQHQHDLRVVLPQLATFPRCVLCSTVYTEGELVTHSDACHHEYHQTCLNKYWHSQVYADNKTKCPVCKEPYATTKTEPSRRFSTSVHNEEGS